ncbi:hypothetical protein [Kocuria rosea]|uniref:hypothetical protein n=1 Tax=Kocuria rosea TaxID=1275 RepID=UPI0025B79690|nr:hypothetical protein [Kocuria rosea]WJZ65488.1 hypothetical protein QR564_12020 [Kocuria rosea]
MKVVRSLNKVVVFAVMGGVLATVITLFIPARYESRASLLLTPTTSQEAIDLSDVSDFLSSQVLTYAEVAQTPLVIETALASINSTEEVEDLNGRMSVSVPDGTYVINIDVTSSDREAAAAEANALSDSLANFVAEIAPRIGADESVVTAEGVAKAVPAQSASGTPLYLWAAIGLVGGAIVGGIIQRHQETLSLSENRQRHQFLETKL